MPVNGTVIRQFATDARITALEETRDALRVRAERAESDLDAARAKKAPPTARGTPVADAPEKA